MKLFIISLVLFIAGCSASTDGSEIYAATKTCENHHGIDYINHVRNSTRCNDGFSAHTWEAIK